MAWYRTMEELPCVKEYGLSKENHLKFYKDFMMQREPEYDMLIE